MLELYRRRRNCPRYGPVLDICRAGRLFVAECRAAYQGRRWLLHVALLASAHPHSSLDRAGLLLALPPRRTGASACLLLMQARVARRPPARPPAADSPLVPPVCVSAHARHRRFVQPRTACLLHACFSFRATVFVRPDPLRRVSPRFHFCRPYPLSVRWIGFLRGVCVGCLRFV